MCPKKEDTMKKLNVKERTGYVFEDKGKWFARITITGENGKRRNIKRTAKSKADAKELLKKLTRQIDDDGIQAVESWRMTFNDLAEYYSTHYAKPARFIDNQKVEGLRDLRRVKGFLIHFRAYFGKQKLTEITYGDVFSYRSERLKILTPKGTTRTIASMNRELAYLRRTFNIALRQGWINKNPINSGENLILTSCERRRERILTFDEEQKLLEVCCSEIREIKYKRKGKEITAKITNEREHLKPLLVALLDTGARLGEMLKLTWRDIDLDKRLITIKARNTKTLKQRQVAITQRFYDILTILSNKQGVISDSLVFGIKNNVRKSFTSACKDAGIQPSGIHGITLHSLRHSAASRLVNGQMPIQMVGRILGHTQPQTTYRYLTANEETLFQASSILESFQNQPDNSPVESELVN
jgi:integrase